MIRAAAFLLLASPACADLTFQVPATNTFRETRALSSHRVAMGPYDGALPVEVVEGAMTRSNWQLDAADLTTLQVLAPLREALTADDWQIVYECNTKECGGFDFRFEIDVTPAPEMFVDLSDFRYLAAQKDDAWRTLIVSRAGQAGFVQETRIDPATDVDNVIKSASSTAPPPAINVDSDVARVLVQTGRAVLSDLDFATGSTELAADNYASLEALAAFLQANPDTTIAVVGHTDAEGSAEGNMAISRQRAQSARRLLIDRHGIAPGRIETHGVGFFAPLTRNDTEEGRELNRRVEVIITSTE